MSTRPPPPHKSLPTTEVGGLPFTAATRHQVIDFVFDALTAGRGGWIITPNVDHYSRFQTSEEMRRYVGQADLVCADGMPLLWAARLQRTPLPDRVAGSDLVWLLAERAAREDRSLYLLGGMPGAAEGAARELLTRIPGLRLAGLSSPELSELPSPDELEALEVELRALSPDLVYVALGSPKQERVIAALRSVLPHTWWAGVGVSLSFMSGQIPRPPAWMQRLGLEWLGRLIREPSRLARRYLVDNLPVALALLARSARRGLRRPS